MNSNGYSLYCCRYNNGIRIRLVRLLDNDAGKGDLSLDHTL